eukprot:m.215661 g.215661  ORF g.215661 m.215661 type:complete len:1263 (-) comp26213_c1_seq3:188-3976(-)
MTTTQQRQQQQHPVVDRPPDQNQQSSKQKAKQRQESVTPPPTNTEEEPATFLNPSRRSLSLQDPSDELLPPAEELLLEIRESGSQVYDRDSSPESDTGNVSSDEENKSSNHRANTKVDTTKQAGNKYVGSNSLPNDDHQPARNIHSTDKNRLINSKESCHNSDMLGEDRLSILPSLNLHLSPETQSSSGVPVVFQDGNPAFPEHHKRTPSPQDDGKQRHTRNVLCLETPEQRHPAIPPTPLDPKVTAHIQDQGCLNVPAILGNKILEQPSPDNSSASLSAASSSLHQSALPMKQVAARLDAKQVVTELPKNDETCTEDEQHMQNQDEPSTPKDGDQDQDQDQASVPLRATSKPSRSLELNLESPMTAPHESQISQPEKRAAKEAPSSTNKRRRLETTHPTITKSKPNLQQQNAPHTTSQQQKEEEANNRNKTMRQDSHQSKHDKSKRNKDSFTSCASHNNSSKSRNTVQVQKEPKRKSSRRELGEPQRHLSRAIVNRGRKSPQTARYSENETPAFLQQEPFSRRLPEHKEQTQDKPRSKTPTEFYSSSTNMASATNTFPDTTAYKRRRSSGSSVFDKEEAAPQNKRKKEALTYSTAGLVKKVTVQTTRTISRVIKTKTTRFYPMKSEEEFVKTEGPTQFEEVESEYFECHDDDPDIQQWIAQFGDPQALLRKGPKNRNISKLVSHSDSTIHPPTLPQQKHQQQQHKKSKQHQHLRHHQRNSDSSNFSNDNNSVTLAAKTSEQRSVQHQTPALSAETPVVQEPVRQAFPSFPSLTPLTSSKSSNKTPKRRKSFDTPNSKPSSPHPSARAKSPSHSTSAKNHRPNEGKTSNKAPRSKTVVDNEIKFSVGQKVMGKYSGHFYPATVTKVTKNSCKLDFADGDKATVSHKNILPHQDLPVGLTVLALNNDREEETYFEAKIVSPPKGPNKRMYALRFKDTKTVNPQPQSVCIDNISVRAEAMKQLLKAERSVVERSSKSPVQSEHRSFSRSCPTTPTHHRSESSSRLSESKSQPTTPKHKRDTLNFLRRLSSTQECQCGYQGDLDKHTRDLGPVPSQRVFEGMKFVLLKSKDPQNAFVEAHMREQIKRGGGQLAPTLEFADSRSYAIGKCFLVSSECRSTISYLKAIAYSIPCIRPQFVAEMSREANPEFHNFLLPAGHTSEGIIQNQRLSRKSPLKDVRIVLTETLAKPFAFLKDVGCKIRTEQYLKPQELDRLPECIVSDQPKSERWLSKYNPHEVPVVKQTWITDTLFSGAKQPLDNYLWPDD